MRWSRTGNTDIEDRRGMGGFALPVGGLGGLGLVIYIIVQLLGGGSGFDNVGPGLDRFSQTTPAPSGDLSGAPDPDKDLVDFMGFVAQDVQTTWEHTFTASGRTYERTKLVLFDNATQTGCGTASSETGPFYCPADRKVFLDLGFFRELRDRFGAPGDFAQAYVVAHEFGHHVQNLLGIERDVQQQQEQHPDATNELSIRTELQADCFAGVWAHSAYSQNLLESGDLDEALRAAASVGDDRIQKAATGRINRETWTHGSASQRSHWFRQGFDNGAVKDCDTFSGGI
jgi:predicted metalloprotease